MPGYKTTYTVDGIDGIVEMVTEELEAATERAESGKTQHERTTAQAQVTVLERLVGKLTRTTISTNAGGSITA